MKSRLDKRDITLVVMVVVFFAIIIGWIAGLMIHNGQYTIKEYSLDELSPECYGIYSTVHSSIPAQNYEQIILCVDGAVQTFRGCVNIYFVDSEFKLLLKDSNMINSDVMDVYIPKNSIEYTGGISVKEKRRYY